MLVCYLTCGVCYHLPACKRELTRVLEELESHVLVSHNPRHLRILGVILFIFILFYLFNALLSFCDKLQSGCQTFVVFNSTFL